MTDRLTPARASLMGLAVGDALGEALDTTGLDLPPAPWRWTDDTEMACSVVHVLATRDHLDAGALADSFVTRYDEARNYGPGVDAMIREVSRDHLDAGALADSFVTRYDEARNYGPGVDAMIREVSRRGVSLARLATETFGGAGSWGNGAAMRVAPLGAWYHDDPELAAREAVASAEVTHTHPEGVAGAVATAVAASLAATGATAADLLDEVLHRTPTGKVYDGLRDAADLADASTAEAAATLGTGARRSAPDTVPLALWIAAQHLDDYAAAVRAAAPVADDVDTVCAIVGGIVAGRLGESAIPAEWRQACEPLPAWIRNHP